MTRVYYKDAHAAIIVLDSTRERTIEGALRWKSDLDQKVTLADGSPVPAILLANKCDVDNQLGDDKLYDLETSHGFVGSFRTSAKESVGIEEAFKFLANTVISTEQGGQYDVPFLNREANVNLDDSSSHYKHDSNCC
uniref:Ras-related protein Rab n=1 Tax=Caenorhabditis japonica TaxID=281687 RepID=A0A8R1DVQ8_CAEJA